MLALSLRPTNSIRALCLYRAEERRTAIGRQAECLVPRLVFKTFHRRSPLSTSAASAAKIRLSLCRNTHMPRWFTQGARKVRGGLASDTVAG